MKRIYLIIFWRIILGLRPYIEKWKKHRCIEDCNNLIKYHSLYEKKWKNISGILK